MKRFNSILVYVDPNRDNHGVVQRAFLLARRNEARLKIVAVCNPPSEEHFSLFSDKEITRLSKLAKTEVESFLDSIVSANRSRKVQAESEVLEGIPFIEMIKKVQREEHDIVMLAARRIAPLRGLVLGSTAMQMLRKCPCPVWVFKPTQKHSFNQVMAAINPVVGVNGVDPLSTKILQLAMSLAKRDKAGLDILHCWSAYGESTLRNHQSKEEVDEYVRISKQERQSAMQAAIDSVQMETSFKTYLFKGAPDRIIPREIQKLNTDVLVMGTVARTGIEGFLIGNTAESVLNDLSCSVLAVKPDGFISPIQA